MPDTSCCLDLLGRSSKPSLAQSVMESTFLPRIYEKVWRPIGFNVAKGWPFGPDTAAEHALARDWLGPPPVRDGAGRTRVTSSTVAGDGVACTTTGLTVFGDRKVTGRSPDDRPAAPLPFLYRCP